MKEKQKDPIKQYLNCFQWFCCINLLKENIQYIETIAQCINSLLYELHPQFFSTVQCPSLTWKRISFLLKNVCQLESVSRSFLLSTALYLIGLEREITYHYMRKNSVGIIILHVLYMFLCFSADQKKHFQNKTLADQQASLILDL